MHKGPYILLMRRIHRLTTQECQPSYIWCFQILHYGILHFFRIGFAKVLVPRLAVKASWAFVRTTGDEQGYSDPESVNHISLIYRYVVHVVLPYVLNSMVDFVLLAKIEVPIIRTAVACYAAQPSDIRAAAFRTPIRDISQIAAALALIVREIGADIWNIMFQKTKQ